MESGPKSGPVFIYQIRVEVCGLIQNRTFVEPVAEVRFADKDETALAVLARVSVVADRLKRGDFAN